MSNEVAKRELPAPSFADETKLQTVQHENERLKDYLGDNKPLPPATIPELTVKHIAGAIASVMKQVGIISKHGVNQFHHYKYASMQDILQKLTPLLAKNGLVIMQNEIGRSMFDSDRTIAIQYAFTIFHTSGEVWPERPVQTGMSRCRDSRGGFDDKSINKCHTAARKYFLLSLFQIATGDEDDADREDKPPSRPIPSYAKGSAIADGEIDDEIPEWDDARRDPAYLPPVSPNVVTAADKAGAPQSNKEPQRGAPAETQAERLGRLRNRLAIAAENGIDELRAMWKTIVPADQRALEGDLRSIYQPRAQDIDAAKTL